MGLSTRALKPDSLDPDPKTDSMWSCMNSTQYTDYSHFALLDWNSCTVLAHCHAAWIRIEAVWRQSRLWIQIPDPHQIGIQCPVWRDPM